MTRDSASALQLLQRDTHLVIVRRFELVLGANRQLPEARVHPETQKPRGCRGSTVELLKSRD